MIRKLPGTTIEAANRNAESARELLDNIFMAGGLVLSQVSGLTGLEPYIVQNWVKRGFLSPPQHKKYTKRQFCRIAIINMLRDAIQIDRIVGLLSFINGRLDDESDDIIDDSQLYVYYIEAVNGVERESDISDVGEKVRKCVEAAVQGFDEPFPGAKNRLLKVLAVMVFAHYSAVMKACAEEIIGSID